MAAEHVIIATTTDSEEAAHGLAARAIEARCGACAQVLGPIISVYRWEGAINTDREWRVEVKTTRHRANELTELLRAEHTYDVPEIIETSITGGSAEYLDWVTEESR
jgi:periplasmic divalent cation tolerance protein